MIFPKERLFIGEDIDGRTSSLYHRGYETTSSVHPSFLSKDAFFGSWAFGEDSPDSFLSVLSVMLGVRAAIGRAIRRFARRIPWHSPGLSLSPLAPRRLRSGAGKTHSKYGRHATDMSGHISFCAQQNFPKSRFHSGIFCDRVGGWNEFLIYYLECEGRTLIL